MMRSPSKQSASNPNLNVCDEHDDNVPYVNLRKRKQPDDCFADAIDRLNLNLNSSISSLRDEMNSRFEGITANMNTIVTTELINVRTMVEELKTEVNNFNTTCETLQSSIKVLDSKQQELSSKISAVGEQISSHSERLRNLEEKPTTTSGVTDKINGMSGAIQFLQHQFAIKEQRDRAKNLEISGVPETKGENLFSILRMLSVKVGMVLTPQDINDIHRVRKFPSENKEVALTPNIIVHFSRRRCKDEFLAACKSRREITTSDLDINGPSKQIFISEHLTPQNKLLFKKLRAAASDHGYRFVWIKDGKLFARKSETSQIVLISNDDDLRKIK